MQKGQIFIFLLIGILIIAAAGGAYYLGRSTSPKSSPSPVITSPTPQPSPLDETTNWKTYTNDEFKFSFKYHPLFTFVKNTKLIFDSTNFDNQKVSVTQYFFVFTTGKILNGQMVGDPGLKGEWQDESSFGVNVIQTNGKTIMQAYNNKQGIGNEITKVTFLDKTGGADEVAKVSSIQNHIRVYRKGNYFFEIGSPQSNAVLPDGSDDILTYINQVLSTFKFL